MCVCESVTYSRSFAYCIDIGKLFIEQLDNNILSIQFLVMELGSFPDIQPDNELLL